MPKPESLVYDINAEILYPLTYYLCIEHIPLSPIQAKHSTIDFGHDTLSRGNFNCKKVNVCLFFSAWPLFLGTLGSDSGQVLNYRF